jgi:UDP-N-acetylmuramoyl-tripeptide--D-alanyl-D-alanine ligase
MIKLTAGTIASAVGGRLLSGEATRALDGFSIDSRSLKPGDLFFAIVAARDGHDFVNDAIARGAAGVVVHSATAFAGQASHASSGETPIVIQVDDTTRALQDLGRFVRRESRATVVAITGSAGKTTTKETIADFLSPRFVVAKNRGNLNNHLGLPLSLLELRHGADVAVMELGMNHPGEIRVLVKIAEPHVRVWTNVGDAHLGHFASRDEIADAKAEILENAAPTDLLICNADDPLVMARASRFAGRTMTFGSAEHADVRAESVEELGLDGSKVRIRTPLGTTTLTVPLLGRGNLANVLAATAVAIALGVELPQLQDRAMQLTPAPHRGAVLQLARGVTVVDDSYNSSPTALRQALEVIAREQRAQRKAAVLGEMLELGDHSTQLHEDCGQAAARAGLKRLIAVGGAPARSLADAAVRSGMRESEVSWTETSAVAADQIVRWLTPGDLVLVKGSRGIRTDLVVDRITAEFA